MEENKENKYGFSRLTEKFLKKNTDLKDRLIWEVAEDGDEDLMGEGKDVLPSFWVKECILDDNLQTLEEDAIGRSSSQNKNPIAIGHLGFKN